MLKKYLPLIAMFPLIMVSCGDKGHDAQSHGGGVPVKVATITTKEQAVRVSGTAMVKSQQIIKEFSYH